MDYRKIKFLYLDDTLIKKKVELFRNKYCDDVLPVNIEKIIELKLNIRIIPSLGLKQQCDTDAFISSDWKDVRVDNDLYQDDRYQNRLRFSLAHEVGHFILHKDIYPSLKINSLETFYKFYDEIPQKEYNHLEIQANRFAGYLLIPNNELITRRESLLKEKELIKYLGKESGDSDILNSYIATPLAQDFGVSESAMRVALNHINR